MRNGRFALPTLLFAAWLTVLPASMNAADEAPPNCEQIWEMLQKARTKADIDGVTTRYQEALRYYGGRQDFRGQGEVTWGLGSLYLRQGKYLFAGLHFEMALDRARKCHDSGLETKSLNGMGLIKLFGERLGEAKDLFEQSLDLANQTDDPKRKAAALNCIAMVHQRCGDYAQAQEKAEQALQLSRTCHDTIGEADALSNLGAALSAQSKLDAAKEHFQNALAIFRTAGYSWGEGWGLFNLAYTARQSKEYDQAVKHGIASSEIAIPLGYLGLAAHASNCLGLALMDSGRYDKAQGFYNTARSLAAQVGLPGLSGWVENNSGYLLYLQKKHDAAEAHLNKALDMATQDQDRDQYTTARANLTGVYLATGRFDDIAKLASRPLPTSPCGKEPHVEPTRCGSLMLQCSALMLSGDTGRASEYAKQALEKARETSDTSCRIDALTVLVMLNYFTGMGKEAEEHLEELDKLADTVADPGQKVRAFGALSSVFSSLGRRDRAAEMLDRMGNAASSIPDPQMKIAALGIVGTAFYMQRNYLKAITYFQEALTVAREAPEPSPVVPIIGFCGGQIQLRLGNEVAAISCFQTSVTAAKLTQNPYVQSLALSALAGRLPLVGQHEEALKRYGEALQLGKEISNRVAQAEALQGMAEIYESLGDYERAIDHSQKALALREAVQDARSGSYLQREIALFNINLNESKEALEQLNKVIDEDKSRALGSTTTTALAYLGQLRARQGEDEERAHRPAKAKEYFAKAEEHFVKALQKSMIEEKDERWIHDAFGHYYLDRGELQKAESHLTSAGYSSSLGKLYLAKHDYRLAREQFDRMLTTPLQQLRIGSVFVANTGLGKVFEGLKDYAQAAEHYQRAIDSVENLRMTPVGGSRLRFMSRIVDVFPRSEPYKGLAKVLFLSSQPKESLEASEYNKARSLAEALAKRVSKRDLPGDLKAKDAEINERLSANAEKEVQALIENDTKKIIEARTETEKTREELRTHVDALWKNWDTRQFARARYPRPPKLEEVKVKKGEALVAYEVSDEDLFIYLVTKAGDRNEVRGIRKEGKGKAYLQELIRRFRAPFEIPPDKTLAEQEVTFDFAAARELYAVLMADVVQLCRQTEGWSGEIIVVPDDQLATVPFDALVASNGGSVVRENGMVKTVDVTFLLDEARLSFAQSLATLTLVREVREVAAHGKGTLLFYYGPDSGAVETAAEHKPAGSHNSELGKTGAADRNTDSMKGPPPASTERVPLPPDLKFSVLEHGEKMRSELETQFGRATIQVVKNEGRDWFKLATEQMPLDSENVFFYTHGVFSTKLPEAALAVHHKPKYRDHLLSFSDVMASPRLKADFVVLAACEAGLGYHISGEGVMAMSAAIQHSWANRVLTTLWEVPEYSTLRMMKSLAEQLQIPRANKRTAFKAARVTVKQTWDHPYYWAPYMFVGPPDD